jgi:hypothetical protein
MLEVSEKRPDVVGEYRLKQKSGVTVIRIPLGCREMFADRPEGSRRGV